jgi:lipopolysaccharide transport system ATP-binding protein
MSNIAIRVEHLSKKYRLGAAQQGYQTFREAIVDTLKAPVRMVQGRNRPKIETFWALDDVSFEVKHGEAVGIIGRNGAGKSTLLKILSRVTRPTRGRADLYGRVGSLLEVGTGFHPELTGRENIYLNGAILGMSRAEITRKFDEIVDFSEVEKFLDTQVKHYSSGMYVRLAFAVAAYLESEILVVDEVLAVGDAEFQKKCLGKMGDVANEGRTVLFVSHNMGAIKTLCSRSILLAKGVVDYDGESIKAINKYLGKSDTNHPINIWDQDNAPRLLGSALCEVGVFNEEENINKDLESEKPITIYIKFRVFKDKTKVGTTVILRNSENQILFVSISNSDKEWHLKERTSGEYKNTCKIPANLLADGNYSLTVGFWEGFYESGFMDNDIIQFSVHEKGLVRGDLPYELNDGFIRPLLEWKSEYLGGN